MRNGIIIVCLLTLLFPGGGAAAQDFTAACPATFEWSLFRKRSDTLSMLFLGDVMLHQKQIDNARALAGNGGFDFSRFLQYLESRIASADIAVANLEFPLSGPPYSGYPVFSTPDEYADYLADCGIDVFLGANNHVLDKGAPGLSRTLRVYDRMEEERSIRYTGIAADERQDTLRNPLMLTWKNIRIALVNCTYGTNSGSETAWPKVSRSDRAEIRAALGRARRRGAQVIIALPHWGVEYQLTHSASQHEFARWLAENGADIIIGSHPHVVQDMEVFNVNGRSVPCFYSLGNAVSNMSAINTRIELLVRLRIVRKRNGTVVLLDPEAEFLWCTLPGRLTDSYATIPVREFLGRRDDWLEPEDYDNMAASYERVKKATGIQD